MVRILAFVAVLTFVGLASAQDDFWPPFQEQWRCLDQSKSYNYIMETHEQLIHSPTMNREAELLNDYDCPVIDPYDPTWCSNGPGFYPVPCNCHAYYRCFVMDINMPLIPCIYKCKPVDLVFDPNTKSCTKEDQAPPGTCYTTPTTEDPNTTPTPKPTTTQPETLPTTTAIPTTTQPPTTTTIPTTTTTPIPTTTTTPTPTTAWPWNNVCDYEGQKLPYPGDCHKYYRCMASDADGHDFDVEVFDCGDWAFDPAQGSCVWDDIDNDLC